MALFNFKKKNEKETVEYFVDTKVDELIERAAVEGEKRQAFTDRTAEIVEDVKSDNPIEYLGEIAEEFADFPKYVGRGMQDLEPEIVGNTLTMRFNEVEPGEVDDFIAKIVNDGYLKDGNDYVKVVDGVKRIIAVDSAGDKLRIFYKKGE